MLCLSSRAAEGGEAQSCTRQSSCHRRRAAGAPDSANARLSAAGSGADAGVRRCGSCRFGSHAWAIPLMSVDAKEAPPRWFSLASSWHLSLLRRRHRAWLADPLRGMVSPWMHSLTNCWRRSVVSQTAALRDVAPAGRRPLRQHQIWANSRLCCAHSHTRTHLRHPAAARLRCASVVPGLSPGAIPWAAGQISREVNTSEIRVNAYATSPGRRRESPRTVVGRACVTRNARTARMTRARGESALCLSL